MSEEPVLSPALKKEAERVDNAIKYIRAAGFTYHDDMIKDYYISLKTRPFVILAGISGTGKTQISRLVAKAFGAKYFIVAVSSSWSSDSDLIGYWNPEQGKYIDTKIHADNTICN